METSTAHGAHSLSRALRLLDSIAHAGGEQSLAEHARRLSLPLSTAHRLAGVLAAHGLLARSGHGLVMAGPALADLARGVDMGVLLERAGRRHLRRLAAELGATVHLGVWDGEMVSYLVKEPRKSPVLTREGGKLEAYCSAIGKVVLANLSLDERERYLLANPFIALTERTITDVAVLRRCLERTRREDFATDEEEVAPGLLCVAVPVRRSSGQVVAAISASCGSEPPRSQRDTLDALRRSAAAIASILR